MLIIDGPDGAPVGLAIARKSLWEVTPLATCPASAESGYADGPLLDSPANHLTVRNSTELSHEN